MFFSTSINEKEKIIPRKRARLLPNSLPIKFSKQLSLNNATSLLNVSTQSTSRNALSESAKHNLLSPKRQSVTLQANLLTSNSISIPASINEPMSYIARIDDPFSIPDAALSSHNEKRIPLRTENVSCPDNVSTKNNKSADTHTVDDSMAKLIEDWNNYRILYPQPWGHQVLVFNSYYTYKEKLPPDVGSLWKMT